MDEEERPPPRQPSSGSAGGSRRRCDRTADGYTPVPRDLGGHPAYPADVGLPIFPREGQAGREVPAYDVAVEAGHGAGALFEQSVHQRPGEGGLAAAGQSGEEQNQPLSGGRRPVGVDELQRRRAAAHPPRPSRSSGPLGRGRRRHRAPGPGVHDRSLDPRARPGGRRLPRRRRASRPRAALPGSTSPATAATRRRRPRPPARWVLEDAAHRGLARCQRVDHRDERPAQPDAPVDRASVR